MQEGKIGHSPLVRSFDTRWGRLLIALVLFGGAFGWLSRGVSDAKWPGWDEFGWVAASDATFRLMFLDPGTNTDRWHEGLQDTDYGAINPNFAKLLIGSALHVWGYDLDPPKIFPRLGAGNRGWATLTALERREMTREHLPFAIKARWLMLTLSAAGAVLLYSVGRSLSSPLLGACAYVFYLLTPLVALLSFVVGTDIVLLVMSLLCVLATATIARWWASERSSRTPMRTVGAVVLLAVVYGSAVATKLNGSVVCIACGLCVAILAMAGRFRHHRAWVTAAVMIGAMLGAFAVFVLLNPQLHDGVIDRTFWVLKRWDVVIARLQKQFGGPSPLNTAGEKVAAMYRGALTASGPFAWFFPLGAVMLSAAGLAVVCGRAFAALRQRTDLVGSGLLLCWSVVVLAMTTWWLPLDWSRYYLPCVTALCMLQALALESGARFAARRRAQSSAGRRKDGVPPPQDCRGRASETHSATPMRTGPDRRK